MYLLHDVLNRTLGRQKLWLDITDGTCYRNHIHISPIIYIFDTLQIRPA